MAPSSALTMTLRSEYCTQHKVVFHKSDQTYRKQQCDRLKQFSSEMMLRYMGWTEAADLVLKGVKGAIQKKQLTYDLARARAGKRQIRVKNTDKSKTVDIKEEITKLVPGATLVSTSGFGDAVINNL